MTSARSYLKLVFFVDFTMDAKLPLTRNTLKRYPYQKNENLQAWDAADDLMVEHLRQSLNGEDAVRILIINDQHGALSCGLVDSNITVYTDSYLSYRAIQLNSETRVIPIYDLKQLSGKYDYVLIRIPKALAFFEDLLCHVTHHLHAHSKIISGIMVKYLIDAHFQLLENTIGATKTSLAQKKARLLFTSFQHQPKISPYPTKIKIENYDQNFTHHSNLFSREKLDIGTRFFLTCIPNEKCDVILDLGCGNGIVGITAQQKNPAAKLIFSDESYLSLQSARSNYANYFPNRAQEIKTATPPKSTEHIDHPDVKPEAEFLWTNAYEDAIPGTVDLVLCNPPFHQGTTLSDSIARQMFRDAHRALKPGGKLRIVGNRHLQYPAKLQRIFGNCQVIAQNNKFIILEASTR